MKNLNLILILFLALMSFKSHAETSWTDNFTLRAGLSFTMVEMRTDKFIDNSESEPDDPDDEARTFGFGGVTSVHYRLGDWELGVASDVLFGVIRDATFVYKGSSIRGEGSFRLVSVGPQVKYFTKYTLFNYATFYVGAGPSWSFQTFVFSDATTTGSFNGRNRVGFENVGGGLFIGLEQIQPFKTDHPMFLEVAYNYMHSYKVSILDASRSADVITLSEGDSNDFSAHYIVVRFGATLF